MLSHKTFQTSLITHIHPFVTFPTQYTKHTNEEFYTKTKQLSRTF